MPIGYYLHKPLSPKHKRNISLSRKGKPHPHKGVPCSEERRLKISLTKRGNKNPMFGKKHKPETLFKMSIWQKGVPKSKEHIEKIRLTEKGTKLGPNNPSWKGGISSKNILIRNSSDSTKWRKSVFERDDYTCVSCGIKGGNLHAHHIMEFSTHQELRFDINNGLTLHKQCHIELHQSMRRNW